jgi:eukaryotic-like serine/threonine-protein kinase
MKLSEGTRVGTYEVLALIGAGGMGEVYRARDTRLGRDVALKVLPEALARDAERLTRFEREAQVLASLNHPNVAAIYGLEDWQGTRILILEFVSGETLAERHSAAAPSAQARHSREGANPWAPASAGTTAESPSVQAGARRAVPIPPDEALGIACQITEGLAAAHSKGIIHRDLKPANIKITPEGKVKILDFGLAKGVQTESSPGDLSNSPTLTALGTREGVILGTAAYMSPEQARGKRLDKSTDIWSFGCVLYEMLTGRQAFLAETVSDTVVAVLKGEPDWQQLPSTTPPAIRRLLRRCLEKDPARRLHDIADARLEIDEALVEPAEAGRAEPLPAVPPKSRVTPAIFLGLGAAVFAGLALLGGIWFGKRSSPPAVQWTGEFLGGPDITFGPRVSPDGRTLAFQAMDEDTTQVAVMDLASGNWTQLTHGKANGFVNEICWSRDGSKLFFDRFFDEPHGIYSISRMGGEERLVLEDAASPAMLPDETVLAVRIDKERRFQLVHYWPQTGQVQALKAWSDFSITGSLFRVLPDGKDAVFFGRAGNANIGESSHLHILDLATGEARQIAPGANLVPWFSEFPIAVSPDGQSILVDARSGDLHQIASLSRRAGGLVKPLLSLTAAPWHLDVGADGSIFADQVERGSEVFRFPVTGGKPERVGFSDFVPSYFTSPVELPDGRVLLPSLRSGRARMLVGKSGENFAPLVDTEEETSPPAVLVGKELVALMLGSGSDAVLTLVSVSDGRIVRRLSSTKGITIDALAASPAGKTIYYSSGGAIWSLPVTDGTPQKVHAGDYVGVDPGGRFLVIALAERAGVRLIRYLLPNGPEEDIPFHSDARLSPIGLGSTSVRKDGKIVVGIVPLGSWFFRLGLLDPATGQVTRIPVDFQGDINYCGWSNDGRVLCTGLPLQAHLWRFRPSSK